MERCSLWFRWGVLPILVLFLAGLGTPVLAQAPAAPPPAQTPAQTFQPQQLDDLVAPIALYPDPLLGQVLVACTYPLELVEAQQWLQANGNLHGQQLTDGEPHKTKGQTAVHPERDGDPGEPGGAGPHRNSPRRSPGDLRPHL